MNKNYRCDLCGKFRKDDELVWIGGEHDEEWMECTSCMSKADLERFKLKRPITPTPSKDVKDE